jgi:hypothetical protein
MGLETLFALVLSQLQSEVLTDSYMHSAGELFIADIYLTHNSFMNDLTLKSERANGLGSTL